MNLRYYIDPVLKAKGSNLLQPNHGDAGYDICTPRSFSLESTLNDVSADWLEFGLLKQGSDQVSNFSVTKIDTGIHVEIPTGYVGLVANKSSVGVGKEWLDKDDIYLQKWGGVIVLGGIIDSSYRGPIQLAFANISVKTAHFKAGDKVAQLILLRYDAPELREMNSLDNLSATARGGEGFGSTGEKA